MALRRRLYKRMYAVSAEGIGLIAGTLAYSRHDAISHFMNGASSRADWEPFKQAGYRTVLAQVKIIEKRRVVR